MTETTYEVRIWKTESWKGKTRTTYYVRWKVSRKTFKKRFSTKALATSFRSKLHSAASEGTAFDRESGLPVTMLRPRESANWLDFARDYVDMKWPDISPKHRKSISDSLIAITMSLLKKEPDNGREKELRQCLRTWFNTNTRQSASRVDALHWAQRHSKDVSELSNPETLRGVLAALEARLDGGKASANTIRLRRTTLGNALDFAVEKKILETNPMHDIKPKKAKTSISQVDRRSVPNPQQARSLLEAVKNYHPYLTAFFALMYFAALRPEEVTNLRKQDLSLPETGWGRIYLEQASPEVGTAWTDTGTTSDQRALKHRAEGVGRAVPCPPELTELLHNHLSTYSQAADGRLFRSQRSGGRVGSSVYGRAWAAARAKALPSDESANPLLAKRPYDLRHAAVSTWLNAGVEPTRVAEWAGHSVSVLLRVYAKCLDGGEDVARARIDDALNAQF